MAVTLMSRPGCSGWFFRLLAALERRIPPEKRAQMRAQMAAQMRQSLQKVGQLLAVVLQGALRIFERALPPEHPYIRTVRENLQNL